jgi:hypothetical protein
MKTNLPEQLTTAEEAKSFLRELYKNGESYHPDDDAQMVALEDVRTFTSTEAKNLNALMKQCYELLPDPCEVLMDLYLAERE